MGHRTTYFCDWCKVVAEMDTTGQWPQDWKIVGDDVLCTECHKARSGALEKVEKERTKEG